MKNIFSSNRLGKLGLFLACFPYFGLDVADSTGIERLEVGSLSNILQMFIVGVSCFVLFLLLVAKNQTPLREMEPKIPVKEVFYIFVVGTFISVWVNTPGSMVSWFRSLQLAVTVALSIYSIKALLQRDSNNSLAGYFLYVTYKIFWVSIIGVMAVAVVSPDLALMSTEERGIRLGGSFIHPNSLALGAVIFFISSYCLFAIGRIRKGWWLASSLVSFVVIAFTDSSSGKLVMAAAIFFLFANKLALPYRMIGYAILMTAFVYVVQETDSSSFQMGATWTDRLVIWDEALLGISNNLIFGVGPFEGVKNYFGGASLFSYFAPAHSHNFVLDAILSRGVLFALPMLALAAYFYFRLISLSSKNIEPIELSLLLIVFVILTHGLIESNFATQVKAFCHGCLVSAMVLYVGCLAEKKSRHKP